MPKRRKGGDVCVGEMETNRVVGVARISEVVVGHHDVTDALERKL